MKKIIILTVALAFIVSAFALESDPSDVVGYVKYECITTANGNENFIALPLEAGYTDSEELGTDLGVCTRVTKFNVGTQGWDSCTDLGFPLGWVGQFNVATYQPYLVYVTDVVDFYVDGPVPDPEPTFNFVTTAFGNENPVMVPLSSSFTDSEELGTDIEVCTRVTKFNVGTQGWDSCTDLGFPLGWVGQFDVEIAQGLVVYVTAEVSVWP